MVQTLTRPRIEEAIVVPDFTTQHEAWTWLKTQASDEQLALVKEQGNCDTQTITKVEELSAILGIPVRSFRT